MCASTNGDLLEVDTLTVEFCTDDGTCRAVDGVSWSVGCGRTLALVGESGCGKSVTALSVLRLIPEPPGRIVGGHIRYNEGMGNGDAGPVDLAVADEATMRRIRGRRISMIFQDPMTSLNPVLTVGDQIAEAIELHRGLGGRAARDAVIRTLQQVGMPSPADRARAYPHELSGGMRQRAMIAMAVSCDPALLIADEPTTALDVTVQAQILDLLARQQADRGMSMLMITHDLGVVAQTADDVCVMYAGRIVERAPVGELFDHPLHPYTQGLLRCIPRLADDVAAELQTIPGQVADPYDPPAGCRFHPRCPMCKENCRSPKRGQPELTELRPGHFVACWEA